MTKVLGVSFVALAAAFAMLGPTSNVDAEDALPIIVTLGDSYINSYGVAPTETFAARLKSALAAAGRPATIVELGYKATSRTGLTWLAETKDGLELQANPANHAVILELGQNDCARIKLDETRANLDHILALLAEKRVPVLVVGTAAYDYCSSALYAGHGADYAGPFSRMFSELATKHGDLLYPDFKEGVTGHPELLQADRDHPNAAGDAIIVTNMLPVVQTLLARIGHP
ncbi:GDSL-type esterase/lipase family protein [Mesorhizobium sp. M1A.T.Ca.IN.004.03.1.1]|uniref:GDSL-type esterase/lipase family protein n=1 Tax=Mesorhizobium sp. M1A.T.Ca.IN.004.03.1.1 TaxID=2496795 RepID=UPI0019D1B0B9|nr:GDSL-type esterase/lipase family protein [Mesorhizobium sp. M1A.T.Ca.IN.004.03.1.1]